MGVCKPFTSVQLFTGLLFNSNLTLNDISPILESHFKSSIVSYSDCFEFNHSSYYTAEMGSNLKRIFVGFDTLVPPDTAYRYKLISNSIEDLFLDKQSRQLNIDPGILSLHHIVLFSTKNFSHRIACGQGIYSELTLLFRNEQYRFLDWTYPDFKQSTIQDYFITLRTRYQTSLD